MQNRVALILFLLIVLIFLSYRPLGLIGQVLADHKPGWWGAPAWYVILVLGYGILVLALLAQAIKFVCWNKCVWRQWAGLLVGLALVRGLLYSSITPPWQSPDEHAHFEYAALLGQLKRVPTLDDLSPALQQQIVSSMFHYDFWRLIQRQPVASPPVGFLPQSGITYDPPTHVVDNRYLYYPQVGDDPPLYYVIPAIAYVAFPGLDIALQLYIMRLTTVLMLVALIGIVIWSTRQLFYNDILLAMSIPAVIAFHPMLAHIGSVLNNEVLATVIATMLLGTLVVTLRSGLDWRRGLTMAGLLVLGLLTKKSTVWIIILIGGVGLACGFVRYRWIRYLVLAAGIGVLFLLLSLCISSQQARYWTPVSSSWGATATRKASPEGTFALRVVGGTSESGILGQRLLPQTALDLRGQTVILSAQVYADSEGQRGELALVDVDRAAGAETDFVAGPEWRNVTLQWAIPDDALSLQVRLTSAPQAVIYFDQVGIVDPSTAEMQVELVRNGSGERVRTVGEIIAVGVGNWLGLGGLAQRLFSMWQDNLRMLLLNPWPVAALAFESFWGNFGAALVVPLPSLVYRVLGLACGLSVLGIGIYIYKALVGRSMTYQVWQQRSLIVLGAALFLALLQVTIPLLAMYGFWGPQGRYLFPVIWPIGVFLTLGGAQLMPRRIRPWLLVGLVVGMIILDCTALGRLTNYFYDL